MHRPSLLLLLFLTLSSCMLGPDFRRPPPPPVGAYTPFPSLKKTVNTPSLKEGGKAQRVFYGEALPQDWWRLFHSAQINQLVRIGLHNSPTIEEARQNLFQAYELLNVEIGNGLYPALNAQLQASRQRAAAPGGIAAGSSIFNVVNASFNASYTFDLFGAIRRQIEASSAVVDNQAYLLQATYLTLTTNIVTTAITVASFRSQVLKTLELIKLQKNALNILQKQFKLGGISKVDVLTQSVIVAQTTATLGPLLENLDRNQHALSVLLGEMPSDDLLPKIDLDKLHLPRHIPAGIPSLLVRQRPDILASEALLHQASALIGVATANLFPSLTLTANYGWQGTSFGNLFSGNNKVWNITGTLVAPIFNGGALMAQRRAAIAAYRSALAAYQQIVLQGFQNVADSLRALEHDAETLKASREAELAAQQALNLISQQFKLGGVTYLALLIAQQQYQQASIVRIRAQAARYADTAALFQALGGGWWCPMGVIRERNCCGSNCPAAV